MALKGNSDTNDSNVLIIKSMNGYYSDESDLPSVTTLKGEGKNFQYMGKVILHSSD